MSPFKHTHKRKEFGTQQHVEGWCLRINWIRVNWIRINWIRVNWIRIWPFRDLFGIFSNDIILAENEEGAVDSEAVLFDRNGVVNGHGPGSLGHGLLVHPLAPRRPWLPGGSSGRTGGTAASIAAGQFVFEASHTGKEQMLLEEPKETAESKCRRSITTHTVVPSPGPSGVRIVHGMNSPLNHGVSASPSAQLLPMLSLPNKFWLHDVCMGVAPSTGCPVLAEIHLRQRLKATGCGFNKNPG